MKLSLLYVIGSYAILDSRPVRPGSLYRGSEVPDIRKPSAGRASEDEGPSGTMKSKPRSDDLSTSHQRDTCSCSTQSQIILPHIKTTNMAEQQL